MLFPLCFVCVITSVLSVIFTVASYGMNSVAAMANMLSSLVGPMNMGGLFTPSGTGFNAAQFLQQSKSTNFKKHCEFSCMAAFRFYF